MMKQSSVLLENRNPVLLETGITGILEQLEYWTNWNTGILEYWNIGILEQAYCSSYSGFASSFCPSGLARLSCSKTSITFVSAMAVIS